MRRRTKNRKLPRPQGKSLGGVTPDILKRAALLFDEVCLITYQGHALDEEWRKPNPKPEWLKNIGLDIHVPFGTLEPGPERALFTALGNVAVVLYQNHKDHDVVPMYHGDRRLIPDGVTKAYLAALSFIPEVVEEERSWEQIADFRQDQNALKDYRALRTFLYDLKPRSVAHAEDLIATRLEARDAALRRHGIKTVLGTVSLLYDAKLLAQAGGMAALVMKVAGPKAAAAAGTLCVIGRTVVKIFEHHVDLSAELHIVTQSLRCSRRFAECQANSLTPHTRASKHQSFSVYRRPVNPSPTARCAPDSSMKTVFLSVIES